MGRWEPDARGRLEQAAMTLYVEQGFENTTVAEIAERAGLTERTQEIGLRKAVGAKKSDIVLQFLLEAAVLTAMGGIAGIIFGWLVSVASRLVFESLPATVPLWAAVLGILVSVGVGLFFGIWPAYKAAGLDHRELTGRSLWL